MRTVAPIKGEWLVEIAPHYYQAKDVEDSTNKKMPKQTGKYNRLQPIKEKPNLKFWGPVLKVNKKKK